MTREDLIEGVIGKLKRTVTGERKVTGKRVRAAIEKNKDARYAHRKAMHMKKFLKGKPPKTRSVQQIKDLMRKARA